MNAVTNSNILIRLGISEPYFFGAGMLKELVENFANQTDLPVEIQEIVECIQKLGLQDEIYLFPVDSDPTKFRGVFKQFRIRGGVYADDQWVTHIAYTKNVPLEWQRVICAKELVHLFDPHTAQTDTEEEVSQLLDKLVGPLSTEDYGFADLQAVKDRLALYQCLPLLLPAASLEIARKAVKDGTLTPAEVADRAVIPIEFANLMLSEHWEGLNGALNDL